MNTKMNDETKIVMEMALNHYEDIYGFEKSDITADGVKDFMEQIAEEAQEAGEADELFHYIMLSEKLRSRVDWQPIVKAVQEIFPEDTTQSYICYDCCLATNQTKEEREKYDPLCKECFEKDEDDDEAKCYYCNSRGCDEKDERGHYHKECESDDEKEICLDYSEFVENFEPKKDYSKIQEDDTIIIQTRPAESKNKARQTSQEWCAFEWKHESEEKWKLKEYNGSSPFAMWWCNQDE
jgi:hypothetical protein